MATSDPLPQQGVEEIVITSTFLVLAYVAVAARFYARRLQRKPIWVDDYLIVAGLIFTTGTIATGYLLVLEGGAGRHIADTTVKQIQMALKLFVPAPLLWAISTSFVKLSILFFYVSIFTMPKIRTAVIMIIVLTVAMLVAVIFESFLLCRPFAYTWDKTVTGGVCGNSTRAYLAIGIVNLCIDLAAVFIPMPVLWSLQMPLKKKVAISAILCLGLLICALSAARIHSVLELDDADFTYTVIPDLIFGALEIELGIVNACLPILTPVVTKCFGSESTFRRIWTKLSSTTRFSSRNSSTDKWTGKNNDFLCSDRSYDHLPGNAYRLADVGSAGSAMSMVARAEYNPRVDEESGNMNQILVKKELDMRVVTRT